jgi:hypothetical protein
MVVASAVPTAPSHAVKKAAQAAASSRHGLINLTRLVKALDDKEPGDVSEEGDVQEAWLSTRKDWEVCR